MNDYTQRRMEEFDIAFPEGGTSGWIGDPSYPADLCCGADDCSPSCDEKKREYIKSFLANSITQAIAEERERVRGEIEKLATCSDCNGTGIKDCEQCERNSHKCSRCFETGEVSIQKDDLLSSLDKEIINPKE